MNAILRISLEGQLQDVFEIEKILLAIFYKMWYIHYTKHMCKWEMPAMTAVIYARYSTDSQREESIEGQIRECTAYAEKNGFTVVKHYIDRAISAKTDNRPQFQQMIKDSERGIFDD